MLVLVQPPAEAGRVTNPFFLGPFFKVNKCFWQLADIHVSALPSCAQHATMHKFSIAFSLSVIIVAASKEEKAHFFCFLFMFCIDPVLQ